MVMQELAEAQGADDKVDSALCMSTQTNEHVFEPYVEQMLLGNGWMVVVSTQLGALVGKVEAAVERLQEYRAALITAAVTGKLDVSKDQTP